MNLRWLLRRSVEAEGLAPNWLPEPVAHALGRHRRGRGYYDPTTAQLLRSKLVGSTQLRSLFREISYQRDLGHCASLEQCSRLLSQASAVGNRNLARYASFLIESGRAEELQQTISASRLVAIAHRCPPVASLFKSNAELLESVEVEVEVEALAQLHSQQAAWRGEFLQFVKRGNSTVCVVGNSPSLRGTGQGVAIDAHSLVIRFNRCSSSWLAPQDAGRKVDVWVRAPGLELTFPPGGKVPTWVILSGADLRYQLKNWKRIFPLLKAGVKVLTVPLEPWASLVSQLNAPPSAGLLVLSWLLTKPHCGGRIQAVGFQEPNHSPQSMPRSRHNWPAEALLIKQLRSAGLS